MYSKIYKHTHIRTVEDEIMKKASGYIGVDVAEQIRLALTVQTGFCDEGHPRRQPL